MEQLICELYSRRDLERDDCAIKVDDQYLNINKQSRNPTNVILKFHAE